MKEEIMKVLDAYGLTKFLPAVLVLLGGWLFTRLIIKAEKKMLTNPEPRVDASQEKFLTKGTRIICWAVILLEAARQLGFNTGSLLTVFATCAAAIALALQGSLSNIASGILMLFTKPFTKGDYIACAGSEGFVESVDLLSTTIVTADNKKVSIPNSSITGGVITNVTALKTRRIEITFGITYGSDVNTARETALKLAESTGFFLDDPAAGCDVSSYQDSLVKLTFLGWVRTPDVIAATGAMNNGLKPAMESAGIEMAVPRPVIQR